MAMKRKGMAPLPTDSPGFMRVRAEAEALARMLEQGELHPVEFGKRYAALAAAIARATAEAGLSSARFAAAEKALDLQTPKSQLERFVNNR